MQEYKMSWDLGGTLSFTWWCEIAELCRCSGNDCTLAPQTWQGDGSMDPSCRAAVLWWWGQGIEPFLSFLASSFCYTRYRAWGWIPLCSGETVFSRRFFRLVWHISVNCDKAVLVAHTQEPFSDWQLVGQNLLTWPGMCANIIHWWVNLPLFLGREEILLSTSRRQVTVGCSVGLDQCIGGHKRNYNTKVVINTDWKRITEICHYSIK